LLRVVTAERVTVDEVGVVTEVVDVVVGDVVAQGLWPIGVDGEALLRRTA
jgi:hypothetical protein